MGMIGLGRMGANMVRRLLRANHECVVYDRSAEAVQGLVKDGAVGAKSLEDFVATLEQPRAIFLVRDLKDRRVIWLTIPAALVDATLSDLAAVVSKDDIIIDGGNSYYIDDIRRARELSDKGVHYVDVGTSAADI